MSAGVKQTWNQMFVSLQNSNVEPPTPTDERIRRWDLWEVAASGVFMNGDLCFLKGTSPAPQPLRPRRDSEKALAHGRDLTIPATRF